ncbi:hypothetical protein PanWU01x14_210440 [Parasponia andersonii]|uniref:Uncharacterized protein n=1 Tax=Parasponia andersonii TaxID=3476 RepID=A0A2P5BTS0_PARAD|nr:hypothetical protein PanWU01x14_210440 [Parasponia andersonii]
MATHLHSIGFVVARAATYISSVSTHDIAKDDDNFPRAFSMAEIPQNASVGARIGKVIEPHGPMLADPGMTNDSTTRSILVSNTYKISFAQVLNEASSKINAESSGIYAEPLVLSPEMSKPTIKGNYICVKVDDFEKIDDDVIDVHQLPIVRSSYDNIGEDILPLREPPVSRMRLRFQLIL